MEGRRRRSHLVRWETGTIADRGDWAVRGEYWPGSGDCAAGGKGLLLLMAGPVGWWRRWFDGGWCADRRQDKGDIGPERTGPTLTWGEGRTGAR
jgi:hypothetical protein